MKAVAAPAPTSCSLGPVAPTLALPRQPLDGPAARNEFELVWPLLERAILAYGDTHRKAHVWSKIEGRDAQLWITVGAALVTEIRVWPSGLREAVGWLAAGDLNELLSLRPRFEAWARAHRCKRVGIVLGRRGWARKLPGYRPAGIQLAKEL